MSASDMKLQAATRSRIAAILTYDARLKDHEAACWLGLPKNIEEAAANAHSALDAVLDATNVQISAIKK